MSQTLLDISADMEALDSLLSEMGGDVTDEQSAAQIEAWIRELSENLSDKADNYAALITTMEKRAAVRREEAARLGQRAGIDEKAARFLKEKLKGVMQSRDVKVLNTSRYRISVAGNGGLQPLTILDEKAVPLKFYVPQPDILDKDSIREAMAAGEEVPGARLEPRGTSLRIK